jgi:hypothetical protein
MQKQWPEQGTTTHTVVTSEDEIEDRLQAEDA